MKKNLTQDQQAARDARKAKQAELFARLAKMNAIERANLAATMPVVNVEGRMLSMCNMCLLAMQRVDVTVVGGFRQWLAKGRCVMKGERGLIIRVPCGPKADNGGSGAEDESGNLFFIGGTVFDVSQTAELEMAEGRNEAIVEHCGNLVAA